MEKEFLDLVNDIITSHEFQEMKKYQHHVKCNLYGHSLKVAYLCYLHHKKYGTKIDLREFVRGAVLHDYYLYNLHGGGKRYRLHWFKHPKIAFENAVKKYPDLTEAQRDIIKNHMFPLTLIPPKTKAGWLVCFYDKVAAVSDRLKK